ncbi:MULTISPECIES: glycosyltransferase family 4 protein [unclassified Rhodococcus (in: high G+C Gram-positive bacteria)]|uniref:glycosyltransferase family 4 protein n=1 Tax=unclassified Rhodococcus (in: high G+C Gram-positive bacteria) TaxID=192944 RepID=UPI0027DEDF68|nr:MULTISPECIES: glycosyltransferase family 4 protein [unclassified Rhodococcus (in: high G+C Gram-positive bacteria)]
MTPDRTTVFVAHTANISGAEKMLLSLVSEALRGPGGVTVVCPVGALSEALPDAAVHVAIPELGLGGEQGVARIGAAARMAARWVSAARTLRAVTRRPATHTVVNSLFALPAARLARPLHGVAWLVHDAIAAGRQRAVASASRGAVRRAVACTSAAAAPVRDLGIEVEIVPYGVPWPVEDFAAPTHSPPVVGMLALLTPWKGHLVLLDAVATLDDVMVELAGGSFSGDQAYVDELHTRAARPDLAGRVRFLGHVDPDSALRRWDVVVSASVLPEAGPLSVLEAMSHGVPVVATDHGGPTEFLARGEGVLVPPGDAAALADALRRVLGDDAARADMGARARDTVATRHDISVTLPRLLTELTA